MRIEDLRQKITDYTLDFSFIVNGKQSGITTYKVKDGVPTMTMWYGDKEKEYQKSQDLLNDPFFDGKSLSELASTLDIEVY